MSFKEKITKAKDKMLDIIFPNDITCIFCGRDIPQGNICLHCEKSGIFNTGNRCTVCDTPIKEGNIICDHCKRSKRHFKTTSCPFIYNSKTRSSIIKLKSDGAKYLAKPFARHIYDRLVADGIEYDVIIPVPSHKKSISKRGYNPAKVLAEELSALSNKPVLDILIKTVHTKNQKYLDYKARQENLENSITITAPKLIKGKRVLIIDDIITTAATIETCACLMTKAKEVHACAVARRTI